MDAADGPIVLVEAINESPHPVIPKLDHTAVKTRQDPWPLTMETQSLHSITLRLKLRQHPHHSKLSKTLTHQKEFALNLNSDAKKSTIKTNSNSKLVLIVSNFPIQKPKIELKCMQFSKSRRRKERILPRI